MKQDAHSALLHQVGDHDHDADVLLPNHSPEIVRAGPQRTLSGNVRPWRPEALKTRRQGEGSGLKVKFRGWVRGQGDEPSGKVTGENSSYVYKVGVDVIAPVVVGLWRQSYTAVVVW